MNMTSPLRFGVYFSGWEISQWNGNTRKHYHNYPMASSGGKGKGKRKKLNQNWFNSLWIVLSFHPASCPAFLLSLNKGREKKTTFLDLFPTRKFFSWQKTALGSQEVINIEKEQQMGFDGKTGEARDEPPSLPAAPGLSSRSEGQSCPSSPMCPGPQSVYKTHVK